MLCVLNQFLSSFITGGVVVSLACDFFSSPWGWQYCRFLRWNKKGSCWTRRAEGKSRSLSQKCQISELQNPIPRCSRCRNSYLDDFLLSVCCLPVSWGCSIPAGLHLPPGLAAADQSLLLPFGGSRNGSALCTLLPLPSCSSLPLAPLPPSQKFFWADVSPDVLLADFSTRAGVTGQDGRAHEDWHEDWMQLFCCLWFDVFGFLPFDSLNSDVTFGKKPLFQHYIKTNLLGWKVHSAYSESIHDVPIFQLL